MPFVFEKPTGTRDILPEKLKQMRRISADIKELFRRWGYEEIETPFIEYHRTVGVLSEIQEDKLIKFLDPRGKTVILRPDFTTPIARLAASVYKDADYPVRLMYEGKVYRNEGRIGALEINQIGMELIGEPSLEGDAEVINLLVQAILKSTQARFKVAVGHTRFLTLLLSEVGCNSLSQEQIFQALLENDYVTYKKLVDNLQIENSFKDFLLRILKMRGSLKNIFEAQSWFDSLEWRGIFQELFDLWHILGQY
ncbi:MAG: ATP phosphoribosyltransferase regulatory subunit, partial [Peptococcales bacterium]